MWNVTETDDGVHCTPIADLREHVMAWSCWCQPSADDEDARVCVHHSLDQRERYETGELRPQ